MQFVCLAFLLLIAGIIYWRNRNDLTEPWFLMSLAVSASMAIVVLNSQNWEVRFCWKFILYLFTGIFAWGVGSVLAKRKSTWIVGKCNSLANAAHCGAESTEYPLNAGLWISFICCSLYVQRMLASASGSLGERLSAIYAAKVDDGFSPGVIFTQMREIAVAISYLSVYELLRRCIFKTKQRGTWKLLLPAVLAPVVSLISTDRNILLRYAIYFIVLFVLIFEKKHPEEKVGKPVLKFLIPIGAGLLFVFFLLGRAKNYRTSLLYSLSIYGGTGLYNFNLWVQDFQGPYWFGLSTFRQLINTFVSIVGKVGIQLREVPIPAFDEFIKFTSANGYYYQSNIYSAMRPYVEDFGYFGLVLFSALTGFVLEILHLNAKKRKTSFSMIIFAFLSYPAVYYSISEHNFRRLHLGLVYEIGWLLIFYLVFYQDGFHRLIGWVKRKAKGKK